jgi:hypothetical protein
LIPNFYNWNSRVVNKTLELGRNGFFGRKFVVEYDFTFTVN